MADTRDKLKKAAITLFLKNGYSKTSIGEIEARAGLAPRAGSFYRHFKSKRALLIEIAKTEISEQPEEFEFDTVNALQNTRAELILIARIFEKAAHRQKPFMPLIEELRKTRFGQNFEKKVNQEMMRELVQWVSRKPAGKGRSSRRNHATAMLVFGSWLFYLGKAQQDISVKELKRDDFLNLWADHWSSILDSHLP